MMEGAVVRTSVVGNSGSCISISSSLLQFQKNVVAPSSSSVSIAPPRLSTSVVPSCCPSSRAHVSLVGSPPFLPHQQASVAAHSLEFRSASSSSSSSSASLPWQQSFVRPRSFPFPLPSVSLMSSRFAIFSSFSGTRVEGVLTTGVRRRHGSNCRGPSYVKASVDLRSVSQGSNWCGMEGRAGGIMSEAMESNGWRMKGYGTSQAGVGDQPTSSVLPPLAPLSTARELAITFCPQCGGATEEEVPVGSGREIWELESAAGLRRRSIRTHLRYTYHSRFSDGMRTREAVGGWSKGVRRFKVYAYRDPFETLGVPSTATDKEIKQAYRKLALKYHPDVNKEPDAQQKFMQIKNAYQILTDEKSRVKYDASKRASPSWDPFSWQSERKSAQKPRQEEEFYGFGQFFKDVSVSVEAFFRDLQTDNRRQASKPKSLWEELAEIGEEFVEFLEKELNINDATGNEEKSSAYKAWNDKKSRDAQDAKKKSGDPTQPGPRDQMDNKPQVDTETEIEDMLAKLKKELGM